MKCEVSSWSNSVQAIAAVFIEWKAFAQKGVYSILGRFLFFAGSGWFLAD